MWVSCCYRFMFAVIVIVLLLVYVFCALCLLCGFELVCVLLVGLFKLILLLFLCYVRLFLCLFVDCVCCLRWPVLVWMFCMCDLAVIVLL